MIATEHRGNAAILRMERGKGNALTIDFLEALLRGIDQAEASAARAVILTGTGNVFSAGVDLPSLAEGGPAYVRRFVPLLQRVFERLATFPKPLIAALNGHAIAGGAIFTFACDQRLLARGQARVGLTEVLVGVVFPAWALEIARFATPAQHFSTLICTGRTWRPEEALARGLVDELVEPERLMDRALEIAEELGAIPSATFAATKEAVRRPLCEAARRQAALTDAALLEHWCLPETIRQINEFAARAIKRRT